jgi:hypothetical protein
MMFSLTFYCQKLFRGWFFTDVPPYKYFYISPVVTSGHLSWRWPLWITESLYLLVPVPNGMSPCSGVYRLVPVPTGVRLLSPSSANVVGINYTHGSFLSLLGECYRHPLDVGYLWYFALAPRRNILRIGRLLPAPFLGSPVCGVTWTGAKVTKSKNNILVSKVAQQHGRV